MLVKVFSLPFDSALGNFNDKELREFLKDKEVISIQEHFFMKNEVPFLTMVIKYFPFRQEADPQMAPQGKRDESWRETLSEVEMGVFNLLREWRSKRSREEGVPPYILFTNKQLAQLIKENPSSLSHLERVEGVGKARVEKYGRDILGILSSKAKAAASNGGAPGEQVNA
jgi:ATP-dependent DNA helicase RecQ